MIEELVLEFRKGFEVLSASRPHAIERVREDALRIRDHVVRKFPSPQETLFVGAPKTIHVSTLAPSGRTINFEFEAVIVTFSLAGKEKGILIAEDGSMLDAFPGQPPERLAINPRSS
jgi:hypothetical protein